MFSSLIVVLFAVKVLWVLGGFFVASCYDLEYRLVPNWLWGVIAPVGLGLSVVECLVSGGSVLLLFGSFVLTVAVAFGVFLFGGVGGADCKALICVGLLFPFFPFTGVIGFPFLVFALACFFGGAIFCCINVCKNLIWVVRGRRLFDGAFAGAPLCCKVLACLFGQRVSLRFVDNLFYLPMEKGGRFVFMPKVAGDDDGTWMLGLEDDQSVLGEELFVWAQPSVPLIPFLLLSLLVAFLGVVLVFF